MLQHMHCLFCWWLLSSQLGCFFSASSVLVDAAAVSSSLRGSSSSTSFKQRSTASVMPRESDSHPHGDYMVVYDSRPRRQLQGSNGTTTDNDNDDDRDTIRISLSIWAAQLNSEADLIRVLENDDVQNGIGDAVLQVLCSVTDLRLVDRGGTFFDTDILDMFDTCRQYRPRTRRRRRTQESTSSSSSSTDLMPAVVSAWHKTAVMLRGSDELLWSTWTYTFPVLRVGQLYIEEAMMNNQGISITDIGDAAVEALEQVSQLALDVSMMDGTLDDILHRTVETHILYASPILQETNVFPMAALDYAEKFQFHARFIYPMRVTGVLMLLSSVTIYVMLRFAARLRRLGIEHEASKEQSQHRDAPSVVHLRDQAGVENLLERSAAPTTIMAPTKTTHTPNGYNVPILERMRAEQVKKYRYGDRPTHNVESS